MRYLLLGLALAVNYGGAAAGQTCTAVQGQHGGAAHPAFMAPLSLSPERQTEVFRPLRLV